jgi:cysteine desulfurase
MIYLDNSASTRCDDRVIGEMLPYFSTIYGNASNTTNKQGMDANSAVIRSRNTVASLLGCLSQQIYWTSGATESNNIAVRGCFAIAQFLPLLNISL